MPDLARRQALYEAMAEAHAWRKLPADDSAYHVFCVEPVSAAYVRFEGSSWQDWTWDPQGWSA